MTRDRIMEVSKIAAQRVADKRASAPASTKIIQRAAELRRKKAEQKQAEPERMSA